MAIPTYPLTSYPCPYTYTYPFPSPPLPPLRKKIIPSPPLPLPIKHQQQPKILFHCSKCFKHTPGTLFHGKSKARGQFNSRKTLKQHVHEIHKLEWNDLLSKPDGEQRTITCGFDTCCLTFHGTTQEETIEMIDAFISHLCVGHSILVYPQGVELGNEG